MTVPTKILELVERFDRNLDDYKQGNYNETQVRREFIDPFFKALGWDMDNEQGYAEAYKDVRFAHQRLRLMVIHEDAIKVGRATKAPDYCFRIGGTRKFFLEAKKPSVNIKDDIQSAYQIRRYAWSAKLPLSILTDFEEFSVYDCRFKPDKTDKSAKVERMLDLHKQLSSAKVPQTKTVLQRQIEVTDQRIDELVYELYNLTKEEIKIVEENMIPLCLRSKPVLRFN